MLMGPAVGRSKMSVPAMVVIPGRAILSARATSKSARFSRLLLIPRARMVFKGRDE